MIGARTSTIVFLASLMCSTFAERNTEKTQDKIALEVGLKHMKVQRHSSEANATTPRTPVPMWHALAYGTYRGVGPVGAEKRQPEIPKSLLETKSSSSSSKNSTGTSVVLVWFKGLRKNNAPEERQGDAKCWLGELIDYDPFLFAGHFAIASSMCSPLGYGPVIGAETGAQALQKAKEHGTWTGAWTDDTQHFKDACKYGASVHYKTVDCGAGSVPAAQTTSLKYGFPCTGDGAWKTTTWNCATMPTQTSKFASGGVNCPASAMSCMSTGQIRDCDDAGDGDWCAKCNR